MSASFNDCPKCGKPVLGGLHNHQPHTPGSLDVFEHIVCPPEPRTPKLGDRVRFTRQMAGFRVPLGEGWGHYAKTKDPTDGYHTQDAIARAREIAGEQKYGHFRVVVSWEPRARRDWDLTNFDSGIIVGKTFRYEGVIEYEDGYLIGVGATKEQMAGRRYAPAVRVPCWEVKQTLNRRAVLVPIDAIEFIE